MFNSSYAYTPFLTIFNTCKVDNHEERLSGRVAALLNSGGFRNLERVIQPLASEAHPKIFGLPCPLSVITTDW